MTITYIHTIDGSSHLVDMTLDEVFRLIEKAKDNGSTYVCFTGTIYKRIMIVIDSIVAIKESVY